MTGHTLSTHAFHDGVVGASIFSPPEVLAATPYMLAHWRRLASRGHASACAWGLTTLDDYTYLRIGFLPDGAARTGCDWLFGTLPAELTEGAPNAYGVANARRYANVRAAMSAGGPLSTTGYTAEMDQDPVGRLHRSPLEFCVRALVSEGDKQTTPWHMDATLEVYVSAGAQGPMRAVRPDHALFRVDLPARWAPVFDMDAMHRRVADFIGNLLQIPTYRQGV